MRSERHQRYLETNENENTTTQNLWDTGEAFLRGKFLALQAYLNKKQKAQINNLTLPLKDPEKQQQTELKVSKRKEIKIGAQISNIESQKKRYKKTSSLKI